MIFQPAIFRAVLRGEVTQARRPYRASDPYYRRSRRLKSTSSYVLVKPYRPREGDRFPVQQRVHVAGKLTAETQGHAIVSDVQVQRAGELTYDDARAMGYRTTSEAMAAWLADHDQAWICEPDQLDECQACGGPGLTADGYCVTCGCDDQPRARFTRRHADRLVWVVRFDLDRTHVPRLLAAVPGREGDANGDYVTSPSQAPNGDGDPGEALTDTEHKRHVQDNADRTHDQWRTLEHAARDAELEQLSLGRRLDIAISEARDRGLSVTREVRVIEKRLQALENQASRRAA